MEIRAIVKKNKNNTAKFGFIPLIENKTNAVNGAFVAEFRNKIYQHSPHVCELINNSAKNCAEILHFTTDGNVISWLLQVFFWKYSLQNVQLNWSKSKLRFIKIPACGWKSLSLINIFWHKNTADEKMLNENSRGRFVRLRCFSANYSTQWGDGGNEPIGQWHERAMARGGSCSSYWRSLNRT